MSSLDRAIGPIVALLLLAWAVRLLVVARRSASWPTAEATIVVSRVDGSRNHTRPRIEFAYRVDGRAHVGHRVAVGPAVTTTGDGARKAVAAHPVGSRVVIAYDPRKPSYGVLTRGVRPMHVVLVVGSLAFMLATVVSDLVVQ